MSTPIGRIQPVQSVACPKCRAALSENAVQLALQGKAVRCTKCRADIKLSEEMRVLLRKSRGKA